MLKDDNLDAALGLEGFYKDERITQYWDGHRALGRMISKSMKLAAPIAWDIYLLFSSGAVWEGESISTPDFWMHQLDERPDLLLDSNRLMAEVQKAIEARI